MSVHSGMEMGWQKPCSGTDIPLSLLYAWADVNEDRPHISHMIRSSAEPVVDLAAAIVVEEGGGEEENF